MGVMDSHKAARLRLFDNPSVLTRLSALTGLSLRELMDMDVPVLVSLVLALEV